MVVGWDSISRGNKKRIREKRAQDHARWEDCFDDMDILNFLSITLLANNRLSKDEERKAHAMNCMANAQIYRAYAALYCLTVEQVVSLEVGTLWQKREGIAVEFRLFFLSYLMIFLGHYHLEDAKMNNPQLNHGSSKSLHLKPINLNNCYEYDIHQT